MTLHSNDASWFINLPFALLQQRYVRKKVTTACLMRKVR